MSPRKIVSLGLAALLAVAIGGSASPSHAGSVTYEIIADTTGMMPGPGGFVDLQLNPAIVPSPATVSASFFNADPDSGTLGTVVTLAGTAAGSLPTLVTMDNSQAAPNELTQMFSVGSFFDVFVTLSGSEIGPGATGPFSGTVLTFAVYDAAGNLEGAMLTVNPNVDVNGNPIVDGTIGIAHDPSVQVILVGPSSVPEPSSLVLMGLGGAASVVVGRRRWRKRAA